MARRVRQAVLGLMARARDEQRIDDARVIKEGLRMLLWKPASRPAGGAISIDACNLSACLPDLEAVLVHQASQEDVTVANEDTWTEGIRKAAEWTKQERKGLGPYLPETHFAAFHAWIKRDFLDPIPCGLRQRVADAASSLLNQTQADVLKISTATWSTSSTAALSGACSRRLVLIFSHLVQRFIDLHRKYHFQYIVLAQELDASGSTSASAPVLLHNALAGAFKDVFSSQPVIQLAAESADIIGATSTDRTKSISVNLTAFSDLLSACFPNKDMLLSLYAKKLCRRVLSYYVKKRTTERKSLHIEHTFLVLLQKQFGKHLTSSIKHMLDDLASVRVIYSWFRKWAAAADGAQEAATCNNDNIAQQSSSGANIDVDLLVAALSSRHWPSYETFQHLSLPPEMAQTAQKFQEFYHIHMRGRKLVSWIYSLGTCTIMAQFGASQPQLELRVTTLQAAVLLLFNSADSLTFSEIKTTLNLSTCQKDEVTLSNVLQLVYSRIQPPPQTFVAMASPPAIN
ncbi:hypothetical protein L7F22_061073 [Adiantum nelumboides]|nr:hypothetical protein [Adiantum nelumboides]